MKTVHKYQIPVSDAQYRVHMPSDAVALHVDIQDHPGWVMLWVEVHPGPIVERTFRVFGTGETIPDEYRHVGTAIDRVRGPGQTFVWHLYERLNL